MPELSIIIPVYKVEKYIVPCLTSIVNQTYTDFEAIIIDDGSPDECGRICDEFARKDRRLKVIHQKNAGVSAARNVGLSIAQGRYIGFADSDDYFMENAFEKIMSSINTYDVLIYGTCYRKEDGSFGKEDFVTSSIFGSKKELYQALLSMPSSIGRCMYNKVFKADCISNLRFPEDVAIGEDFIFLFEAFGNCDSGIATGDVNYNVVERSDSATRKHLENTAYGFIDSSWRIFELAKLSSNSITSLVVDFFLDTCIRYTNQIKQTGDEITEKRRIKKMMHQAINYSISHRLLEVKKIAMYIIACLSI